MAGATNATIIRNPRVNTTPRTVSAGYASQDQRHGKPECHAVNDPAVSLL
ncbi:MAG: hypothetical protein IJ100_06260 [Lachnospiraceae bacterium]|nr:hypothetical protein [Lachnospiraceae bacterium]